MDLRGGQDQEGREGHDNGDEKGDLSSVLLKDKAGEQGRKNCSQRRGTS